MDLVDKDMVAEIAFGGTQDGNAEIGAYEEITCALEDSDYDNTAQTINQAGRCDDSQRIRVLEAAGVLNLSARIPSSGPQFGETVGRYVSVRITHGPGITPKVYAGVVIGAGWVSNRNANQLERLRVAVGAA